MQRNNCNNYGHWKLIGYLSVDLTLVTTSSYVFNYVIITS